MPTLNLAPGDGTMAYLSVRLLFSLELARQATQLLDLLAVPCFRFCCRAKAVKTKRRESNRMAHWEPRGRWHPSV